MVRPASLAPGRTGPGQGRSIHPLQETDRRPLPVTGHRRHAAQQSRRSARLLARGGAILGARRTGRSGTRSESPRRFHAELRTSDRGPARETPRAFGPGIIGTMTITLITGATAQAAEDRAVRSVRGRWQALAAGAIAAFWRQSWPVGIAVLGRTELATGPAGLRTRALRAAELAGGTVYRRDISHSCRSPASVAVCSGSIVPVVLSAPNTGVCHPHEQTAWTPPSSIWWMVLQCSTAIGSSK